MKLSTTVWRHATYVAIATLITIAGACGSFNIFSLSDDISFGRQMDQQIQSTPSEYPILQNEGVRSYVQGVVDRILQAPTVKYRGQFPYKVTIINDDKTVNAFATPGGYIYVYTGLLRFLDNEAALAGVIGHEIAHAEERHGSEHMTTALGADVALQIALGNNPTRLAQIAGNAAVLLGTLQNSRSDEIEADTRSFEYLRATSYYPGAIKFFFEKMMQRGGGGGGVLAQWTSTHPTDQDRIDNINTMLREANVPPPTAASLMADPYRAMLRSLR